MQVTNERSLQAFALLRKAHGTLLAHLAAKHGRGTAAAAAAGAAGSAGTPGGKGGGFALEVRSRVFADQAGSLGT